MLRSGQLERICEALCAAAGFAGCWNRDGVTPKYEEAKKGENAVLCEQDLYGWDLNEIDPIAVFQNFSCEIERLMGIFPNVPKLDYSSSTTGVRK